MTSFEQLISPMSAKTFLSEYWNRNVLHIERADANFYSDVLTTAMLDDTLSGCALLADNVDLGQNSVGVPKSAYSDGKHVIPSKVLACHAQGNTIILRAIHLWIPTLRSLCHAVGTYFHAPVQANVYLTPSQTRSAYPHWDAHDIFVLQIAGRKRWTLHEAPMVNPLHSYQFDRERHVIGRATGEIVLSPGDLAYIPRGCAHDPSADEYSVHVSVGVRIKTWADLLTTALHEQIQSNPAFREAVPIVPGENRFDLAAGREAFMKLDASELIGVSRFDEFVEGLSRDVDVENPPSVSGQLQRLGDASALAPESRVQVEGRLELETSADRWTAFWNDTTMAVPLRARDAFQYLASHRCFTVGQLPAANEFDRLAIAQKLVEEGYLRVSAV